MDHEIVWLVDALDEMDEIAEYISRGSPTYAAAVVRKIRDAARDLARFSMVQQWA